MCVMGTGWAELERKRCVGVCVCEREMITLLSAYKQL